MRRSPARAAAGLLLAAALGTGALAGCSKSSGSEAAFCDQVAEVPALETVLSRFSETDPAVLQDRIAKARDAYDQLADDAPDQIADATDDVVALVDEILDAVEAHPTDPTKASDQVRSAMADHADIAANRKALAAYAAKQCGVELDATLSTGSSSTSTTAPVATTTTGG